MKCLFRYKAVRRDIVRKVVKIVHSVGRCVVTDTDSVFERQLTHLAFHMVFTALVRRFNFCSQPHLKMSCPTLIAHPSPASQVRSIRINLAIVFFFVLYVCIYQYSDGNKYKWLFTFSCRTKFLVDQTL